MYVKQDLTAPVHRWDQDSCQSQFKGNDVSGGELWICCWWLAIIPSPVLNRCCVQLLLLLLPSVWGGTGQCWTLWLVIMMLGWVWARGDCFLIERCLCHKAGRHFIFKKNKMLFFKEKHFLWWCRVHRCLDREFILNCQSLYSSWIKLRPWEKDSESMHPIFYLFAPLCFFFLHRMMSRMWIWLNYWKRKGLHLCIEKVLDLFFSSFH